MLSLQSTIILLLLLFDTTLLLTLNSTRGKSMRMAATQSPGMATVGLMTRPNCVGSMSKWMKPPRPSACGVNGTHLSLLRFLSVRRRRVWMEGCEWRGVNGVVGWYGVNRQVY